MNRGRRVARGVGWVKAPACCHAEPPIGARQRHHSRHRMGQPITNPPPGLGRVEQRRQLLRCQHPFEAATLALAVAFCRLMPTHEQTLLQLDDGHTIPPTPVQLVPDSAQGVLIPRRQQGMVWGRPALAAIGDPSLIRCAKCASANSSTSARRSCGTMACATMACAPSIMASSRRPSSSHRRPITRRRFWSAIDRAVRRSGPCSLHPYGR
jgi:hypothetical protein